MIISPRLTALMLILIVVLPGCSWFGKDEPEYLDSVEGKPLKIPAGLDAPTGLRPVVISVAEMRMPAGEELAPMPPRVVSTSGAQDTNTYMAWSAQGAYLLVKDTPESVALRLRFAIERSGMILLKRDDTGAHKFQYRHVRLNEEGFFRKMKFWREGPVDYSSTYRTGLKSDGEETRVYLYHEDGRSCDTATTEHVLGIFMERLG